MLYRYYAFRILHCCLSSLLTLLTSISPFSSGSECYVALIHLLGYPPVIAATPFPNFEVPGYWIGNYDNPSYVPYSLTSYTDQMSLLQRLHNAYIGLYFKFMRSFYYLNQIDELSKEIFGDGVPHVKSLDDHVVLAFVNHHPVLDYPRPTVPAFIPVPGLQLKPPKKLPQVNSLPFLLSITNTSGRFIESTKEENEKVLKSGHFFSSFQHIWRIIRNEKIQNENNINPSK